MEDPPQELDRLFDKLRAMDAAASSGSLNSEHYQDVDCAIAGVLQQLSPVYRAGYPDSDGDSVSDIGGGEMTRETKRYGSPESAPFDHASAKRLHTLLAQHSGPLRGMVTNKETLATLQGLFPSLEGGELEEMLSTIDSRAEEAGAPVVARQLQAGSEMEDPPEELDHLFDKLRATDEAASSGSLNSVHYRDVDCAIAEVLQQLSPVYRAGYSDSNGDSDSGGKGMVEAAENLDRPAAPAKLLQKLVAQHPGPLRDMVTNEETLATLGGLFPSLQAGELEEMLLTIDSREEKGDALVDTSAGGASGEGMVDTSAGNEDESSDMGEWESFRDAYGRPCWRNSVTGMFLPYATPQGYGSYGLPGYGYPPFGTPRTVAATPSPGIPAIPGIPLPLAGKPAAHPSFAPKKAASMGFWETLYADDGDRYWQHTVTRKKRYQDPYF